MSKKIYKEVLEWYLDNLEGYIPEKRDWSGEINTISNAQEVLKTLITVKKEMIDPLKNQTEWNGMTDIQSQTLNNACAELARQYQIILDVFTIVTNKDASIVG